MGEKITIYFYTERIKAGEFCESKKPAVTTEKINAYRQDSYESFKNSGGIKVVDFYQDNRTHVRISFWKTRDGYELWLKDPKNQNYLGARNKYQIENLIEEQLEGPKEATSYA